MIVGRMRRLLQRLMIIAVASALAGPAWAQDRSQTVSDLAFSLGESHALRQLCQGDVDQYWRERMQRMIELEAPDLADRPPLAERFNDGFRAARGQFALCTVQSRAAERSAAARGKVLAGLLARGMASR
jgi:uncharacterized protein (TIGR02301 family)